MSCFLFLVVHVTHLTIPLSPTVASSLSSRRLLRAEPFVAKSDKMADQFGGDGTKSPCKPCDAST